MHQDQRSPRPLSDHGHQPILRLLTEGAAVLQGRMPWSSNYTFLVELRGEGATTLAVYKPGRGERPLWDFPGGLYRREAAAWVLSEELGWDIVPPTVVRDGPLGEGSMQHFVTAHFEEHYFTLYDDPAHHDALRTICAFDLVANNTDRKSGHCLLGTDGRIRAIDNGLCFHPQPKLRTVIWEFGGESVPEPMLADFERVLSSLPGELAGLLTPEEVDGLRQRGLRLLRSRRFPDVEAEGQSYPWPLV